MQFTICWAWLALRSPEVLGSQRGCSLHCQILAENCWLGALWGNPQPSHVILCGAGRVLRLKGRLAHMQEYGVSGAPPVSRPVDVQLAWQLCLHILQKVRHISRGNLDLDLLSLILFVMFLCGVQPGWGVCWVWEPKFRTGACSSLALGEEQLCCPP